MARLNDPPVLPTESIDALKRRFIRQNREIARVNSTQSQRIRNLETEISRLLAENIALREQAIAAHAEAEKWKTASRMSRDVRELKSRLETKLGEVNALVEELGGLPDKAARRSSTNRRKSGFSLNPVASPDQRDWRNRQTLGGVLAGEQDGQDGRLPAILEDKYYPRRTLENQELHILTALANAENEDTESPEIGPPPVAHFEEAEPIAYNSMKSPKRLSGGMVSADDDLLSIGKNVEARRKRRTSSLLQDMSTLADESNEPSVDAQDATSQVKPSGKRKFEASALENDIVQPLQHDDFEFSRRTSTTAPRPRPSRFTPQPLARERNPSDKLSPQKGVQSRTVLAPKSTNSPTKKVTAATVDKAFGFKDEVNQPIKSTSRRTGVLGPIRIASIDQSLDNDQDVRADIPPKTPAPLEDVMSPPLSAIDTEPKIKSMEAAITNSVEDVLNGSIGRGSRRARAAVSYAEPSLRDKMRRPDKKLVGAVEGLSKPTNASDRESSREPTHDKIGELGGSANKMRTIKIKSEKKAADDDEGWKSLAEARPEEVKEEAASPLQDKKKSEPSEFRRKRTFSESEGTRHQRRNTLANDGNKETDLHQAISRLSIFDHPTSSPVAEDKHNARTEDTRISRPSITTTTSRRTSDKPSSIRTTSSAMKPRPHTIQPSQPSQEHAGKENIHTASTTSKLTRSSSVQGLNSTRQTTTTTTTAAGGTGGTVGGRLERSLGARRRSMMV